nr:MAG TPA: hypothetical protein [Caudoviricetes sp.]
MTYLLRRGRLRLASRDSTCRVRADLLSGLSGKQSKRTSRK